MIHPAIQAYTRTTNCGAGFSRRTSIFCFSGPHFMFDKIGELLIHYSPGKRCWLLKFAAKGRSWSSTTFPTSREALDEAHTLVNLFYAKQLAPKPEENPVASN